MAAYPVTLDKRYARLAEVARQRATVNKPYGEDRNRGTHIRKLNRIATDQKIFSEKISMREHKPMQVIILVDFSGSMRSTVDGKARGTSVSRLEAACSAAAGAAKGLAESRCEVAVYGHTACLDEASNVVVWKFKGFNDSLDSMMYRINQTSTLLTRENKDGYAIQYVGRKFTSRTRKKLLIVISDGSPLAPHYHGAAANEHTQQQVDKLRKQGIEVLSISISDDARYVNDRIYGKKNNIFNESPHVIEEVIKALL
jgi:nitric oxide reductase activation protein